jgi:hypothetical protein
MARIGFVVQGAPLPRRLGVRDMLRAACGRRQARLMLADLETPPTTTRASADSSIHRGGRRDGRS